MAIKYFCDICDKEKDIWDVVVDIQGEEFVGALCQECIEELTDILTKFFKMKKPC